MGKISKSLGWRPNPRPPVSNGQTSDRPATVSPYSTLSLNCSLASAAILPEPLRVLFNRFSGLSQHGLDPLVRVSAPSNEQQTLVAPSLASSSSAAGTGTTAPPGSSAATSSTNSMTANSTNHTSVTIVVRRPEVRVQIYSRGCDLNQIVAAESGGTVTNESNLQQTYPYAKRRRTQESSTWINDNGHQPKSLAFVTLVFQLQANSTIDFSLEHSNCIDSQNSSSAASKNSNSRRWTPESFYPQGGAKQLVSELLSAQCSALELVKHIRRHSLD